MLYNGVVNLWSHPAAPPPLLHLSQRVSQRLRTHHATHQLFFECDDGSRWMVGSARLSSRCRISQSKHFSGCEIYSTLSPKSAFSI